MKCGIIPLMPNLVMVTGKSNFTGIQEQAEYPDWLPNGRSTK